MSRNFHEKVIKAKIRAQKEDETNASIIRSAAGELVKYGDEIQLMHRDSKGFLSTKSECSETELIGYKLEVMKKFNSGMIFMFLPRYKSHTLGESIQYGDDLRLFNTMNMNFLSISPYNIVSPKDFYYYEDNPYIVQKVLSDPKCFRHTAYLGGEKFSTWKIFLHSRPLDGEKKQDKVIRGGDLVRIKHSELDAMLTSSLCFEDQTPEIYFRDYYGEYIEEKNILNSIWEISHNQKIFQGSTFELDKDLVTLRHLNSGRLLCIETLTGKVYLEPISGSYSSKDEDENIMRLMTVQRGMTHLEPYSTYRIQHKDSHSQISSYLSYTEEDLSRDMLENKNSTTRLIKDMQFAPLENHFFDERRIKACFSEKLNIEEAFIFTKVPPEEEKDIFFLRSAMPEFLKISRIYKYKQNSNINRQSLVKIEELLKRLISFLFDLDYDPDKNYLDVMDKNEPQNSKQIIFKDLNFIEILVDLIHYPFYNNFYSTKDVHNKPFIPQIISLSYNCIRYAIMEYRPSELHASQWLDLFISYSLGDLDDEMKAKETLTELIDNNKTILETRIKRETIVKFIMNLLKSKKVEKKFVDILRAICICDEEPMHKNQLIISKIMLLDDNVRDSLILPLVRDRQGNIKAREPWSDLESWIKLEELEKRSKDREDGKFYYFYCSLIFLLSDLCQERNYSAINVLRTYFSVDICITVICSKDFSYLMRSTFCRLIQNLWIDAFPFIKISIPSNLKIWKDLSVEQLSKSTTKNFENLKQYEMLINFIFGFLSQKKTPVEWNECSNFMLQAIELCTKMFDLGFFNNFKQFENLQKSLENILQATDKIILPVQFSDREVDYAKLDFNKIEIPPNLLEIKKKICLLMKKMIVVQNDFKLNLILKQYKKKFDKAQRGGSIQSGSNATGNSEAQNLLSGLKSMLGRTRGHRSRIRKLLSTVDNTQDTEKREFQRLFEEQFNSEEMIFMQKTKSFVCSLMVQTLYKDPTLKSISLDLLYTFYKSTDNLAKRMDEIQILEGPAQLKIYQEIDEIRNYLFRLSETIEVWYKNTESDEISQLMLLLNSLEKHMHEIKESELRPIEGLEESTSDTDKKLEKNQFLVAHLNSSFSNISKFVQDLCRNANCLDDLIEILTFISISDQKSHRALKIKRKIAYMIHLILAQCCSQNQLNKRYLNKYLNSLFLSNLKLDGKGYNVIVLLNYLLSNNQAILFDAKKASSTIHSIFENFYLEKDNSIRLAYYMYTLQRMIYFNSFSIRQNQNAIISRLVSSNIQHKVLSRVNNANLVRTLARDFKLKPKKFNYKGKSVLAIPDEICFDLAFIELISNCSFDKNAYAENIAQSIITMKQVKTLMALKNKHILVDYELYKYIFHVFVETEKAYTPSIGLYLFHVMQEVKDVLKTLLINSEWKKDAECDYYLTHKELVSDYQVRIDLLNLALLNIKTFITEFVKDGQLKVDRDTFHTFFLEILELLEKNLDKTDNTVSNNKIQATYISMKEIAVSNLSIRKGPVMKKYFDSHKLDIPDSDDDSMSEGNFGAGNDENMIRVKALLKKSNMNGKNGDALEKNSTQKVVSSSSKEHQEAIERKKSMAVNPLKKHKSSFLANALSKKMTMARENELLSIFRQGVGQTFDKINKMDRGKSSILNMVSSLYFKSPRFNNLKEMEFKKMLLIENHQKAVFDKFLESLNEYLDPRNNQDNEIIEIGLSIYKEFVNSAKRITSSSGEVEDEEASDDEPEAGTSGATLTKFKQDLLIRIGVAELLCKIIGTNQDPKIIDLALDVCCKILEGGNLKGQNEFLRVFKKPQIKVIMRIRDLMSDSFNKLSGLMMYRNSVVMKKLIFGKKTYTSDSTDMFSFEQLNSTCIKILRFLQLLCEGHNQNLQDYLRQQLNEEGQVSYLRQNIDMIQFVVDLFGSYIKFFNSKCTDLGLAIIEFLTESIQGPCSGNQLKMMNSKILDFCKDFMNDLNGSKDDLRSKGFFNRGEETKADDIEKLGDLFTNTIQFLLSLLESNHDKRLIERIGNSVDLIFLLRRIKVTYFTDIKYETLSKRYKNKSTQQIYNMSIYNADLVKMIRTPVFNEDVQDAFDLFTFIQIINDHCSVYRSRLSSLGEREKEAFEFFEHVSGHIELVFQNKLQKVYFIIHPACGYLTEKTQTQLMNSVRRDNANEKISDFLNGVPPLFDRMDHNFKLAQNCGIKPDLLKFINDLCFIVAWGINGIMFFTFEKQIVNGFSETILSRTEKYILMGIGCVQVTLVFMMIVLQFFIHTRYIYFAKLTDSMREFKKKFILLADSEEPENQRIIEDLEKDADQLSQGDLVRIFKKMRKFEAKDGENEYISGLMVVLLQFHFYGSDFMLLYYLFYFICSLCGLLFEVYFVYGFALFEIVVSTNSTKNEVLIVFQARCLHSMVKFSENQKSNFFEFFLIFDFFRVVQMSCRTSSKPSPSTQTSSY